MRDEVERFLDVTGKSITPNLKAGSSEPQADFAVGVGGARESAAASPSPHSKSSSGSSAKPSHPNDSTSALVQNPEASSSTGGPAVAPPSSSNNNSRVRGQVDPEWTQRQLVNNRHDASTENGAVSQ